MKMFVKSTWVRISAFKKTTVCQSATIVLQCNIDRRSVLRVP